MAERRRAAAAGDDWSGQSKPTAAGAEFVNPVIQKMPIRSSPCEIQITTYRIFTKNNTWDDRVRLVATCLRICNTDLRLTELIGARLGDERRGSGRVVFECW